MIKEVNHACGKLNEKLGISVPLPNPKKETLKAASVCNFAAARGSDRKQQAPGNRRFHGALSFLLC